MATKRCSICRTVLVYDADGTLSGMGFECWYCPKCGFVLPVTAQAVVAE